LALSAEGFLAPLGMTPGAAFSANRKTVWILKLLRPGRWLGSAHHKSRALQT
jgi:hypothetical protein